MRKLVQILFLFLGAFLSLHGVITVFLPTEFRYWKELIILIFFLITIFLEGKMVWKHFHTKKSFLSFFKKILKNWTWSEIWAQAFLVWGIFLVIINDDHRTASIAFRYLGLGFFVFLCLSRLLSHFSEKNRKHFFHFFSISFIVSCTISVFFGTWAKFFGGFEILKNFYITTISSWVPGQTVTIYHEAGNFIRMQGASSGPIEFSHLLFVAFYLLFITPYFKGQFKKILKWILNIIFIFGIFQSFSRATLGAIIITILIYSLFQFQSDQKFKHYKKIIIGIF